MNLSCAQHVFANVPANKSPTGKRGYQTLFYDKELGKDAVRIIEDRSIFTGNEHSPPKWQYYALPNKQYAIARTQALAERDEFGRKGRYLTHTLVLSEGTFSKLAFMPFDILWQAPWFKSLDEAYAQGDIRSGEIGILSLDVTPRWHVQVKEPLSQWPAEQRARLARLAQRVASPTGQKSPLHIVGNEDGIIDTLMVLFLYAAPSLRRRLSFDSYAEGCDWERSGHFILLGYPTLPRHAHIIVDASAHHVESPPFAVPENAYETWLVNDGLNMSLQELITRQGQADILNYALSTKGSPPGQLARVPEDFQKRFAWLNRERVYGNWLDLLPRGLSSALQARIRAMLAAEWWEAASAWFEGVQEHDVTEFVLRICLDIQAVPDKADQKVLARWIKGQQHALLSTFPPFWAGRAKKWRVTLEALTDEEYGYLLFHLAQWPRTPIALQEALLLPARPGGWSRNQAVAWDKQLAGKFKAWLQYVAPGLQIKAWKQVLHTLEFLPDAAFQPLADIAPMLPLPSQQYLQQWILSSKRELPELTAALGVPPRQTKSRLKRFLKRGE